MIYVMSDIHGQKKLFDKMLKLINFGVDDTLYVLGDVIDRGPDGLKILLKIMKTHNMHMLMGNHELMMYNSLVSYKDRYLMENYMDIWFHNGGKITLQKFLEYTDNTKEKILNYINKLPSEFNIEVNNRKFILCHAIPHPSSWAVNPFENTAEGFGYHSEREMAAWERHLLFNDKNFINKTIIHGHTATKCYGNDRKMIIRMADAKSFTTQDAKKARVINIDCGCAAIEYDNNSRGGRLGCLRLDDLKEFYVS